MPRGYKVILLSSYNGIIFVFKISYFLSGQYYLLISVYPLTMTVSVEKAALETLYWNTTLDANGC